FSLFYLPDFRANGYPHSFPTRRSSDLGYCAGVERAVETVKRALALYGTPVYVRKQIVHNSHVVRELEEAGAIFVDSVHDVPEGAPVVFSAHGVAPAVRSAADDRHLTTIDATCPLVTKVHTQARRYAARGYSIVLIGHARHEEVEGTTGEAPEAIVHVQPVSRRISSTTLPRSTRTGSPTASPSSASRRARRLRNGSCSECATGSAHAASSTSTSSDPHTKTSSSAYRSSFAAPSARPL